MNKRQAKKKECKSNWYDEGYRVEREDRRLLQEERAAKNRRCRRGIFTEYEERMIESRIISKASLMCESRPKYRHRAVAGQMIKRIK